MLGIGTFDGISSGLDTTRLVDAIITAERANARLMEFRQEQKTNELTSFSSLEALLVAFKSETSRMARSATFNVSSFDVSDSTILDASGPGLVATQSYEIEVRKLAQSHQIASQGFSAPTDSVGTGSFTIQLGEQSAVTVTLSAGQSSLSDLKDAINASEADVTASIINDGSSANGYRLVLTGNSTGIKNRIVVTSGLTGGSAPDFLSSSFDTPEVIITDSATTTSTISLGATASYTGSENKTYTFTVAGSGAQTLGAGEITVNWSDGVNSGTLLVNQADTEFALAGAGSDGLKVSFSAGDLTAGDIFQVQSFSPQLQSAQDAEVAVGTSGAGSSPIILRGTSNTLNGALPGINITLKKVTAAGEKVTVSVGPAYENLKGQIRTFVEKYNKVVEAIDKQFQFKEGDTQVGTLLGDSSLLFIQSRLRNRIGSVGEGLSGELRALSGIGIRHGSKGQLKIDENRLDKMLKENWEGVQTLFSKSGTSTNTLITFISATTDTVFSDSGFNVDITQAATQGYLQGKELADPAITPITLVEGQNTLSITADGLNSELITLSAKTYSTGDALAAELQTKIDNDDRLAGHGLVVTWEASGSQGHLQILSGSYGGNSQISVEAAVAGSAADVLGLSGADGVKGQDVEGTINGEAATGHGQLLTGDIDNVKTEGLVLRIELTASDLLVGNEGVITYTRGIAGAMDAELESLTNAETGFLSSRRRGLEFQIDDLKDQIKRFDERLLIRRNALLLRFREMEKVLAELQNKSSFIADAALGLSQNFRQIANNSRR